MGERLWMKGRKDFIKNELSKKRDLKIAIE